MFMFLLKQLAREGFKVKNLGYTASPGAILKMSATKNGKAPK